jgi:hypothetical protein
MQLLNVQEFRRLFKHTHNRAFHIETQDGYAVDDEATALARFIETGEFEYDPAWRSWDDHVKEVVRSGMSVQRARVVTEPHTDYTRFLYATTQSNLDAGEDIRWLSRNAVGPSELTSDDWWSFDDEMVAFTTFRPDGNLGGFAVTTDPVIVHRCLSVRDKIWSMATPHQEYRAAK